MAEVIHKTELFDPRSHAPGAVGVGAQYALAAAHDRIAPVAEAGQGIGQVVGGGDVGQALGTVVRIVVVAAEIPAVQAGHAPVRIVFAQQHAEPALAIKVFPAVVHAAVDEIPTDPER